MNTIAQWLLHLLLRFVRTLDWSLCAALFALMAIALAVLYSAGGQNGMDLVVAQGARYGVGLAAMWGLSRVTPLRLRDATPLVYAATLLPLLLVLATIVLIAVPTALVLLQPDFGTAMLVAISGCFVLFLAGLPWWWFAIAFGGVAGAAPVAWLWLLKPYQKDRILTFLDPESDPLGAGWNIIQSKIAIGSGGMTGQGWMQGSQSHLDYLPEHTTDFIFAVLSEEFGWIGVATVLALYLFVVGRCLWIAAEARDGYARLLAGSLGLAFFVYVIVNGGMISGLLPVVGVPMPLLSYGGTAAVSLLAGLGVVMSVRNHRPIHG